ncbi:unnamed protein product [Periconia digitata]|uniref:Uncharacterized protein n=1 Tax=Periconia digitata TaxID=1303443 RepID=A0A9W4XFN3_9PLEO|nr:unnamed protein product [Periconia digitata]
MRFTSTIFALSSVFFTVSLAVPTIQTNNPTTIGNVERAVGHITDLHYDTPKREIHHAASAFDTALTRRTDDNPLVIQLTSSIEKVKEHTACINTTVAGDLSNKDEVISSIKGEVLTIIQLVSGIFSEVSGFLSGGIEVSDELKTHVSGLCFELLLEILFTLKACIDALKISIFELLGSSVFLLLSVCLQLITSLDVCVEGVLSVVFGLLGGVSGILGEVLGGLLDSFRGVLGDGFNLISGALGCLL